MTSASTASREWQDRQARNVCTPHLFAKAVWRAWWRTRGSGPRVVLAGPGGDVQTAVEGYALMRPGMGDTLVCLPSDGYRENIR